MRNSKSEREIEAIQRKAIRAMKKAVAKVMEEHRRAGDPVAIWKDGKVVWTPVSRLRLS